MSRLISIAAATIVTLLLASGTPAPEDNVFFGNLHSHTSFSDGSGTPAQAYKRARDVAKLDFLAITEHNHSKAEDGIDDDDPRKDGLLIANNHALYNGTAPSSLISTAKTFTVDGKFVAIFGQERRVGRVFESHQFLEKDAGGTRRLCHNHPADATTCAGLHLVEPRWRRIMSVMIAQQSASTQSGPETVVPIVGEHIAIKPGYCGGKPHVAGHRVKVQHVAVWHERMGMTPEEIVATYPTLTLSAVYAALAYYHSHRAEIDADIEADERFVAEMRVNTGPSRLRERLAERHGKDDPLPPG